MQGIVSHLQARKRLVEDRRGEGLAGLDLDLLVQKPLRVDWMSGDPVGHLDVGPNPVLDQIRMTLQELRVHYQEADDELSVGPKSTFVHKEAAVAFADQACGPRFRGPGGIEIFLQEKR